MLPDEDEIMKLVDKEVSIKMIENKKDKRNEKTSSIKKSSLI